MPSNRIETTKQPGLFVAHGAPDVILSDIPVRKFLTELGPRLPTPRGIVVVSAHWQINDLRMTGPSTLETIHDFFGWPAPMYDIVYPASGAEWLNERLARVLDEAGYTVRLALRRGLDHGAWVPLSLMFPKADISVVQLSLLRSASPELHFRIGQALDGLRHEGVMILGSGGLVHNLRQLMPEGTPPDSWAQSFDTWLFDRLETRALPELFDYASQAEYANLAHPTDEHLLPLFVSMGAGWSEEHTKNIHRSFSYGNLSMASYAFVDPNAMATI